VIGIGADLVDVERFRRVLARTGAPSVRLHRAAAAVAGDCGVSDWRLTLTHTHALAQAVAVAVAV
jgi:phosphopantetheinyl transferase (holo-ACP synthase)